MSSNVNSHQSVPARAPTPVARRFGALLRCSALLACAGLAASLLPIEREATGCGGTPPPPVCGKSTTLVKTPPTVFLVAPAGGVALFPVSVGIQVTGACPPPLSTTISLTVSCVPGPGAFGSVTIATPVPGVYNVLVPVAIPPGPPRTCLVSGTATTTWADGSTSIGNGDTVFCIVEPSPIDPTIPRLDIERLTEPIRFAHPGDARIHVVRLTNNDPTHSVTVILTADSEQAARFPGGSTPPVGSGDGLFSVSDPGTGDNFPIEFLEEPCDELCVDLPMDPVAFQIPTIQRSITIPAGESRTVGLIHRSWPICGCASACENRIHVDGHFADGSEALACTGFSMVLDCNVPPDFACSDSGTIAPVTAEDGGLFAQAVLPTHELVSGMFAETLIAAPGLLKTETFSEQSDEFRGRITTSGFGAVPAIQVGTPVNVVTFVQTFPIAGDSTWSFEMLHVKLPPAEFNDSYILVKAKARVQAPGLPDGADSFLVNLHLISLDGLSGALRRDARIDPKSIVATIVDDTSFSIGFTAFFDPLPGFPNQIQSVNLRNTVHSAAFGTVAALSPCQTASNDCAAQGGPGCADACCCALVCEVDPFCCDTAWDGICVNLAALVCDDVTTGQPDCPESADVVVTQSNSAAATAGQVACAAGGITTENQFARSFDLGTGSTAGEDYLLTCVDFGYSNSGAPVAANLNVYVDTDGGAPVNPAVDLSLIGSLSLTFDTSGATNRLVTFPEPICVPANSILVIELDIEASTDGFAVIGGNTAGETGPTFIRSAPCGLANYVSYSAIGFPDANWALTLFGESVCKGDPCPWDLDGSGQVGGGSLGELLNQWGPCPGCPADFNGDGVVDGSDLGELLSNWGPCP